MNGFFRYVVFRYPFSRNSFFHVGNVMNVCDFVNDFVRNVACSLHADNLSCLKIKHGSINGSCSAVKGFLNVRKARKVACTALKG